MIRHGELSAIKHLQFIINHLTLNCFGSSSKGNCTFIEDNHTSILVDFGFGRNYIGDHLRKNKKDFSSLSGVLLTHCHRDHINQFTFQALIENNIPIYCHEDIAEHILHHDTFTKFTDILRSSNSNLLRTFNTNSFEIDSMLILPLKVPHDSFGGCYGYSIYSGGMSKINKVSIATDMGSADSHAADHFADSDILVIEANHDTQKLKNSSRPYFLKERILNLGHLSNEQCAGFLNEILEKSKVIPKTVLLAHLSSECNEPALAKNDIKNSLSENHTEIEILCASPNSTSGDITIG